MKHKGKFYLDRNVAAAYKRQISTLLKKTCFKIKFKKEMGITPNHYINMCKIARAKRMLARGYPITQTAK